MLVGAGDAAVFPSVLRVIAVWFPDRQAPFLVQMTGIVGQTGQIIAILPLAALLHATSWSVAFGSLAGLGALFTMLTFAVIRNRPPDRDADVSVDTETGAIRVVTIVGRPARGLPRVVGAPGDPARVLVALHDAVRGHGVRAAVGLPVPHRRRGALARHRLARRDVVS